MAPIKSTTVAVMAFQVEDGTGLDDATSYVSVAEATNYFAVDRSFAAIWSGLTPTSAQENLLSWASRVLDQKTTWLGSRVDPTSGLRWPRSGTTDRDDQTIDSDVVPVQVKQATLEMAKFLYTTDLTTSQDIEFLKRAKLGELEVEYQDDTSQSTLPPMINDLLAGLGAIDSGGPRFVKILKV